MDRIDPPVFEALVALYGQAEAAYAEPIVPTPGLWLTLAFLSRRARRLDPLLAYWQEVQGTHDYAWSEVSSSYRRSTMAVTAWNGICRAIGVRQDIEFMDAVYRACRDRQSIKYRG